MSTPTVEVSCNSSHLTLNCSTVSGCPVTYRWERRSQDPGVGHATFPGAVLYLPDPGQHNCTYTCVQKIAAAATQSLQRCTVTPCPEGDMEHVCCCPFSVGDVSPLSMVPDPPSSPSLTDEDCRLYQR